MGLTRAGSRQGARTRGYGTPEAVGDKRNHAGMVDNNGRYIGDGIRQGNGGKDVIRVPGGAAPEKGSTPTASATLGGVTYWPMVQGNDLVYVQRGETPQAKPGERDNKPAPPTTDDPPKPDQDPPAPDEDPDPAPASDPSPTNRDVDSPNGNGAKGTQTGPRGATMDEVNALLGRQGVGPLRNPFESNNLPATGDYRPANTENQAGNQNIGPIADGDQYARNVEAARNGANTALSPDNTSGDASLRFTPREDNGIGAAYAPPTLGSAADMRRRSSFLDAKDSLSGLRAVEADAGVFAAEGKYFTVNPNAGQEGQNALTEISREQGDILKDGGPAAQEFLQQKMADLQGDSQFSETMPPEVTVDGVNGIGPVTDGERYADMLGDQPKNEPESRNVPGRRFQPGGGF